MRTSQKQRIFEDRRATAVLKVLREAEVEAAVVALAQRVRPDPWVQLAQLVRRARDQVAVTSRSQTRRRLILK